jgi:hypothetical protein
MSGETVSKLSDEQLAQIRRLAAKSSLADQLFGHIEALATEQQAQRMKGYRQALEDMEILAEQWADSHKLGDGSRVDIVRMVVTLRAALQVVHESENARG